MGALPDLSLYLVLDPILCAPLGMVETARQAARAGAGVIQLRDKTSDTAGRIALGNALRAALAGTGAALIVNDDVDAAIAIGADGLHIGQSDIPASEARRRIGPDMLLGLSVTTPDQASAVDPNLIDYAGTGPIFATATKQDHDAPLGLPGLRDCIARTPVPSVAIGGLYAQHVPGVIAAGAQGIAVVSAICGTPDPGAATASLLRAITTAKGGAQ